MKEKKYVAEKIENFQAEIPVEEYMKECVDVATFLEFCKECSNYGKLWCCPPYTFDVEKIIEQISQNSNYGAKIISA